VTVLLTLTDVEPAVRLNAMLEKADIETVLVSPMDDVPAAILKAAPEVIVITGGLFDMPMLHLAKQQAWGPSALVGFADVYDDVIDEKLRALGYVDIYAKPVNLEEVFNGIRRLIARRSLQHITGLVGESQAIREVLVQVEQMAPVSSTVLIEGESGTGKELVARAIHQLSPRRAKTFIAVNVGALAETLLESELFGHEKGAFTGAAERRLGRFELADGGTLFLDEISEIPPATQVKLLRVLEGQEVMRVGGTQSFRVNVRVVAATNRPLREQVESGFFRADLYYRLNVLRIYLPPLRERREDIPILVRRFIAEFSARHDRPFHGISADAMQILTDYPWPGNVRELRNLVESMVVLSPGHEIRAEDIPRQLRERGSARFLPVPVGPAARGAGSDGAGAGRELEFIVRSLVELKMQLEELRRRIDAGQDHVLRSNWVGELRPSGSVAAIASGLASGIEAPPANAPIHTFVITPGMTMVEIERAAIEAALRETRGNRRKAAEMLAIGERTMYRKLKEYQIATDVVVASEESGDGA
jgi:DNA-binding NtrC family response regulator